MVELDWLILANHAEVREGVVGLLGGAWDVVNAPEFPPADDVAAFVNGAIVARIFLAREALSRPHAISLWLKSEDGADVWQLNGGLGANEGEPPSGDDETPGKGFPMLIPLLFRDVPVPARGWYRFELQIDGAVLGAVAFRVR